MVRAAAGEVSCGLRGLSIGLRNVTFKNTYYGWMQEEMDSQTDRDVQRWTGIDEWMDAKFNTDGEVTLQTGGQIDQWKYGQKYRQMEIYINV